MTATNIEDMFLFPILETDDKGHVLTDNRGQVFTRKIHPSEVDLRKYIANRDEYLYYDITSQAERAFDTILHQDCLRRQDQARKAHFFEHGLPFKMGPSPRDLGKSTTGTSVCLELCILFPLPGVILSCLSFSGYHNISPPIPF